MKTRQFIKGSVLLLLTSIILVMGSMAALADMMWEPEMDNFYSEHKNECVSVNKTYIANGANGYVTTWQYPDSDTKVSIYINGTKFHIYNAYADENGNQWGLINTALDKRISFWIPMKDLTTGNDGAVIVQPASSLTLLILSPSFVLIALVAVVVVVTVIIIFVFWRKKEQLKIND